MMIDHLLVAEPTCSETAPIIGARGGCGKLSFDYRYLLLVAVLPFIYLQMRLFATQSQYADRLADAIEAETQCTRQTRLLIDQISMQQGRILSLEEEMKRQEQECRQLRALVQDLQGKGLAKLMGDVQAPVAAVVVMACNRADYLDKTIKSILKYQSPVASRYPLFVSQDGSDPHVKSKALSYDQLTYMQNIPSPAFFLQIAVTESMVHLSEVLDSAAESVSQLLRGWWWLVSGTDLMMVVRGGAHGGW
ncbi:Alpha-1-3-mannosyl-glycoprotein 2-beta-N-acetylglucosaminyltransferase [Striga hermonthica]|uniref:Alpha-1,3-mannosyl-glycoprotein 2-beta-N-acetylglucosaminyltransferase n=1 Tax=Striga hermonthica TaxID=68872 RepID=A0A9N7RLY6_STRHE|nr:Alpha-1-3-mannosyl-glycoprotein 2-beta-N-acetylglucosaminyltransferase [Striga hermonthica]